MGEIAGRDAVGHDHFKLDTGSPGLLAPPFPTRVRGRDLDGMRFEEVVTLDNLCANGLSLRLGHCPRPGTPLFIVMSIVPQSHGPTMAPAVAIRGTVVHAMPHPPRGFAIAVNFDHYRFLFEPFPA